jgi:hypothetical protein
MAWCSVKKAQGQLYFIKKSKPPAPLSSWSLRQTVCSTFSGSGWSVVRSASLVKGGTSKKRPSPHLHKVPTRNNKTSPRTLQSTLVFIRLVVVLVSRCHFLWPLKLSHCLDGGVTSLLYNLHPGGLVFRLRRYKSLSYKIVRPNYKLCCLLL